MKKIISNNKLKALCFISLAAISSTAFSAGQAGDKRVQGNASLSFGDVDLFLVTGSIEEYFTDQMLFGAALSFLDAGGINSTTIDITGKYVFPLANNEDLLPYAGVALGYMMSDVSDDAVLSINGGADYYIAENYGVNSDLQIGLVGDYNPDVTISFGMFYEF